jgi:Leucine-rich repeat (LRR) protein
MSQHADPSLKLPHHQNLTNPQSSRISFDQHSLVTNNLTTQCDSKQQPLSAIPSSFLVQYAIEGHIRSPSNLHLAIPRSPSSSAASFTEGSETESVHATAESKSAEISYSSMTDVVQQEQHVPDLVLDDSHNLMTASNSSSLLFNKNVNDITITSAYDHSSALVISSEVPDEFGIIHYPEGRIGTIHQKDLGQIEFDFPPLHVETHAALTQCFISYLDLKSVQSLASTSKIMRSIVLLMAASPMNITVHKPSAPLDASPGSPCELSFKTWGKFFSSLTLHRAPMVEKNTFPDLLALTPNLLRLNVHDLDSAHWNDALMSKTLVASVPKVEELRLHCSDLVAYDITPYTQIVQSLSKLGGGLRFLKKLTLFTRLDAAGSTALTEYLNTPTLSRHLIKLKLSTTLISSPGGNDVLAAVGSHGHIQKLTIMRPEGMGEPIRKSQCAVLAQVMVQNKSLYSLHLRRAGMWTDTLAALVPSRPTPNIRNIKLDSNSLAYLSAAFFSEAMDNLLSRLSNLESLHLGNNQLDSIQAIALAASFTRHRVNKLCNLTLGSNDIGDAGLRAICKALPPSMKQLYLHGCDIHDEGLESLREALDRMPDVWGLGLNGNPISDAGVPTLSRAIRGRTSLRDIGITLSDVTDAGIIHLADAISTCDHLRFIYLYTSGFKAATKISEVGKAYLRARLPRFATAAFDHKLSRYLKTPQ